MKLLLDREFSGPTFGLYKRMLRRMVRATDPYHPVEFQGRRLAEGQRGCSDRWAAIKSQIEAHGAETLLDLGCAEGYFVRSAAVECGCVALGVDADLRRLTLAESFSTLDRVQGAGFMLAELTPALLQKLPRFDLVVFLSVMHHIMYECGVDHAREIAALVRSKTNKVLIFDMGQSDETEHEWAGALPDMGADPHAWIREFLLSAGFSSVDKLAETDSYQGHVRRAVFAARP